MMAIRIANYVKGKHTVSMKLGKQFLRTTFVLRFVDLDGSGFKYALTYVFGSWPPVVGGKDRAW